MNKPRPLLLVLSQTFAPDPASVGQHMTDVAVAMARRGHRVRVYASANGYDDPAARYARRENLHGVDVRRLPFASFGKKSILTRVLGTFTFMTQVLFHALFTRDLAGIFFSTSPPLIGATAAFVGIVRRVPLAYWAMDLNPDQLIAMGKLKPTSPIAFVLERVNRWILRRANLTVALDRFMAERLKNRADFGDRLVIIPPWHHGEQVESIPKADNPFVARHGLTNKFVIMYSGNHSPANPLQTLLDAARLLKDDPRFCFMFIGGGVGKRAVEAFVAEHGITNAICLPYQPLADLKYSLTAADVHVVSLGDRMTGIIHPCKIYGAMAAAKPVLYIGPSPSHITDLLDKNSFGWRIAHGDVDGAVQTIRAMVDMPVGDLQTMSRLAQDVLLGHLSHYYLCGKFCDALEKSLRLPTTPKR